VILVFFRIGRDRCFAVLGLLLVVRGVFFVFKIVFVVVRSVFVVVRSVSFKFGDF
jgi:hypothetical protein